MLMRGEPPGRGGAPGRGARGRVQDPRGHAAGRGRGAACSRRRCGSTKGNKTLTAKMLGIDPKTVFRKLKQGEAEDGDGERPTGRRA